MKIVTIANNCMLLTKNASEWSNRQNGNRGVSYTLGFLYDNQLYTLRCDKEVFDSAATNTFADVEIVSQDGQYASITISRVLPLNAPTDKGSKG